MLLKLLFLTLLTLVSTSSSIAQAVSCQPVKIAFYVEAALGARDGVTRLYKAEELAVDPGFVPNRSSISIEQEKANYEKRRKVFVEPILSDLRSKMAEIARSNDFLLFEGVSLDEPGLLLAFDNRLNITPQLIAHLNDASFKPRSKTKLNVPPTRIGIVNLKNLYGAAGRLHGFESISNMDSLCKSDRRCKQLFDRLQTFSTERTYGGIFDSSRDLPSEIREIACYDATDEFIKFFNSDTHAN